MPSESKDCSQMFRYLGFAGLGETIGRAAGSIRGATRAFLEGVRDGYRKQSR